MSPETKEHLRESMARAMRDLLGRGYVDDYYHSCASDFVMVAEGYVDAAVKEALDSVRAS